MAWTRVRLTREMRAVLLRLAEIERRLDELEGDRHTHDGDLTIKIGGGRA